MKREKKMKNKKRIQRAVVLCTLVVGGLAVGLYSQEQPIQAKPDDGTNTPVVVDKNTTPFELPYDSLSLEEAVLKNDSKFTDFVQSKDQLTNLSKATDFIGYHTSNATADSLVDKAIKVSGEEAYIIHTVLGRGTHNGTVVLVKVNEKGEYLSKLWLSDLKVYPADWNPSGDFLNPSPLFTANATNIDNGDGTATVYYSINGYQSRFAIYNTKDFSVIKQGTPVGGYWGIGYTDGIAGAVAAAANGATANLTDTSGTVLDSFVTPLLSKFGSAEVVTGRVAFGVNRLHRLADGSVAGNYTYAATGQIARGEEAVIWSPKSGNNPRTIKNSFGLDSGKQTTLDIISQLSDSQNVYYTYWVSGGTMKIIKYNLASNSFSTVNEFPNGTSLKLVKTGTEITFIGYAPNNSYGFSDFQFTSSAIAGKMDQDLNIISLSAISTNVGLGFSDLVTLNNGNYLAFGITEKIGDFVNTVGVGGWNGTGRGLFFGTLKSVQDYSPAIEKPQNLNVDIDMLKADPTSKDGLLLKNGKDNTQLKVFDQYDINLSLGSINETDYQEMINRNPLSYVSGQYGPIDWEALGFEDNGKIGPNRVTYFVTDSQKQTTSTSRVVNKIDSHTVLNKVGAIGAYNFGIKLADVGNLTDASLRNPSAYAQLMAWDLEDETVDVLSLPAAQGVEIDSTQLNAIRNATEFGVFDLTFTLNYGDEPKKVTIKVFVSEDGPVGDYSYDVQPNDIPWDVSRDIREEDYAASDFAKIQAYKISTGEKIDEHNTSYQLLADVTALNAADPNPADYTATQNVKVPITIWTTGATPTLEATFKTIPDTTVYYRVEDVKVSFVDWNFGTLYDVDGNKLQEAGVVLKNQIVGKQTAIKTNQEVVAAVDAISLKGYEKETYYLSDQQTELTTDGFEVGFEAGNGHQYYLRFKGLLEIVSVPTLDFGQGEATTGTLREDNPTVTGSLIISDTRADTTKNWTLKAELSSPFTSTSGNTVIPNAIRYKRNGQAEFILDGNKQVLLANNAGTFGLFNVSDTWGTTKEDEGFKFEAPAVKVHEAGKYKATIKYYLSDAYEP